MKHTPVLGSTVLDLLSPQKGETVIDVTVGLGGHARQFLERIGKTGTLIGIDADEANVEDARIRLSGFENVCLIHGNFRSLHALRCSGTLPHCDILFADLGVSSPHFDDPSRGFSFRSDGPLDCRFDRSQGLTASAFIAHCSEKELADVFRQFGELRQAHPLSRMVKERTPQTTRELSDVVQGLYGRAAHRELPKVFQALRIAVNDELDALRNLLEYGPPLLKPGGRMGVLSFHSLEDRMVKRAFRDRASAPKDPITGAVTKQPEFELLTRKAVQSDDAEIESNPRARSVRFRAIRRVLPCSTSDMS